MIANQLHSLNSNIPTKTLRFFFIGYLVYLCSHFFAQKAIYSNLLFYFAVIAPLAYYVSYSRDDLKILVSRNKILMIMFLYLFIHSILVVPEMKIDLILKGSRNVLSTFLFVFAGLMFFHKASGRLKTSMLLTYSITCGIFALISILLHIYGNYDGRERLIPLGFAKQEIIGTSMYTAGGIMSLYLLFTATSRSIKTLHFLIYSTILVMTLMTFSRGPILAYIACTGLGFLFFQPHFWRVVILCSLALISAVIFIVLMPEYIETLQAYLEPYLKRGTSYRLTLWQLAIERIADKPILGYGTRGYFTADIPGGGNSPHNLFLSAAYYFGIPTLLMLVTIMYQATSSVLRGLQRGNYNSLLIVLFTHGIFSVLTDHGQFIRGNTPVWMIFWLPICMCLANYNSTQTNTSGFDREPVYT